ncbi:MAG: efflux RND transporter periplasmic adaptor subunit [Verrucomicrobiaceae bacterium]|nr:MAG: efflux RND transporter periplasmic adaptor subunit [Verrucomicrobiaceae bacterium]
METKPPSLDALRIDRSKPLPAAGGSGRGWIILVLLLLTAGVAWWFMRGSGVTVKTAIVKVEKSNGSSARTLLNASGYVTARVEATVSSKITGKVAEILVEEGMRVEKDQTVARLDSSNAESGLRLAVAQLESARLNLTETEHMVAYTGSELKRYAQLESTRAVSNADVARASVDARTQLAKLEHLRAEVIVAERQVDDWKQQVDDTIIRAPFSGVVTTKDSQPGEMISPMSAGGGFTRTGICTLVDMSSLEIEVDVGESFINRVKAGQPVEATLDAYQDWKIPGKVIAIIPTADRQKATVKVRVAFDKLDPRILPQMGVKVAFQSDEPVAAAAPAKPAVSVPKEAVQKDKDRNIAWVVREGKVERRAVTVGNANGASIILTAGLSSGETVVLNPPATLADGAVVTVETSR